MHARFRDVLTEALKPLEFTVLKNTGIDSTAALVLYPDSLDFEFRSRYQSDIQAPCERANVETITYPPRSERSFIESLLPYLMNNNSTGSPMTNVILLDQGLLHFDECGILQC
jgi:hypothetical protein